MKNSWWSAGAALVVAILATGSVATAQILPAPTAKCTAGKLKCLTGYATGLEGCQSKDSKLPNPTALGLCNGKAQTKWDGGALPEKGCFEKLEIKGLASGSAVPCLTIDDLPSLESQTNFWMLNASALVEPPSPAVNLCASGKEKCLANLVKGLVGCHGKFETKPGVDLRVPCIDKVKTKFDGGIDPTKGCFEKLEIKYPISSPTPCPSYDDTASAYAFATTFVNGAVASLSCGNGIVNAGEQCDDGNSTVGDGCSGGCLQEICGNGVITPNETCDDGNTSNNDACPSDCVIDACTPNGGSHQQATVSFAVGGGANVAGISVLVDYPEGKVSIPGSGGGAASRISGFPSGTSAVTNDLDHALREVVQENTPFTSFPAGQLFKIDFETCSAAPPLVTGDFTGKCTVISASNLSGGDVTANVTCSVSVP